MAQAILQYNGKTGMVLAVLRPSDKRLALMESEGVSPEEFLKGEKIVAGADAFLVVPDEDALGLKDVPFHRWQVVNGDLVVTAPKPADLIKQRGAFEVALNAILAAAFKAKRELTSDEQAEADALQAKLDMIDGMVPA